MSVPLGQRYRVALLRGAWRRGPLAFLRQAGLLAKGLLREKELVFLLRAENVPQSEVRLPEGLQFREARRWEDLPQRFRDQVEDPSGDFRWNGRDWFGRERRLWVGTLNGEVAVLGWWFSARETSAHYFPIPQDTELLIHSMVPYGLRGRNLQALLRLTLMQQRVAEGVRAFYVHVRDYNTPSLRTIERLGFKPVGYGIRWRFRRKPVWHLET